MSRKLFQFALTVAVALVTINAIAPPAEAQPFATSSSGPANDEIRLDVPITVEQIDAIREEFMRAPSVRVAGAPGLAIAVFPAPAPNAFGSLSWNPFVAFATFVLRYLPGNGVLSPGLNPQAYQPLRAGLYMARDTSVTSFNSWWAVENPGAPFGSEFGNRLHAGLVVEGDCITQFTLADVNYSFTSSDGGLDYVGDLAGTTLNGTTRIGIGCGPDGLLHTPDDIVYVAGEPDTTLIDALIYVGVGNAYWPGGPGDPLTGQEAINFVVDYVLDQNVVINLEYNVLGFVGSQELVPAIFHDGFETNDASAWSAVLGD